MTPIRETLTQAGYISAKDIGDGEYTLTDTEGKQEVWMVNDGHASYGIVVDEHDLEFCRSL